MKAPTLITIGLTLTALGAITLNLVTQRVSLFSGVVWPVITIILAWAWRMSMAAAQQWKQLYLEGKP